MSSTSIQTSPSLERAVRFHEQCVLIPEPQARSRLPRLVTKSYSLPLWKRKGSSEGSEVLDLESSQVPVDAYIGLKVSVPRFTTKSLSPSRDNFTPHQLQSCLVHQDYSITNSPEAPATPRRLPVLRRLSSPLPSAIDLVTVPLRPCCIGCESIWEQSMREGDEWKEKFTRGARRRRKSSSDIPRTTLLCNQQQQLRHSDLTCEFSGVLAIRVDEVDKKRRQGDVRQALDSDEAIVDSPETGTCLKAPIQEEDEDQLFPLPPPKRSPNASPIPSPSASSSCLALGGVKDTPFANTVAVTVHKQNDLRFLDVLTDFPLSPAISPSPPSSGNKPFLRSGPPSPSLDIAFLDADMLPPSLSRVSGKAPPPPPSPKSYRASIAKAGSGLLKGMVRLGSPTLV